MLALPVPPLVPPKQTKTKTKGNRDPNKFAPFQRKSWEVFPCSLMSDPIADVYIMSRRWEYGTVAWPSLARHDILRRLPKNLQSVIFTQEAQARKRFLPIFRHLFHCSFAFSTLFAETEPTDGELLDMLRQNESLGILARSVVARRWFTFRRSMHGEVLLCRDQETSASNTELWVQERGGALRASTSTQRINA